MKTIVTPQIKQNAEMFNKGTTHGIFLAYRDIRDLLNERLKKMKKKS